MNCNQFPQYSYENILRANKGILTVKVKVQVRDNDALSIVYTPGVATPCLEIQKDITLAYKYTNKGNSIIIVTDSSGKVKCGEEIVPNKKWNNNAAMPYLEAFSACYKTFTNVDAYPIILDANLIPDAQTLLDTINAISPSYSGVEFFLTCPTKIEKFKTLLQSSPYNGKYCFLDGSKKREIDEMLKTKKTTLSANTLCAAIWRVALDCHSGNDLDKVLDYIVAQIKNNKININEGKAFNQDFFKVFNAVIDYMFEQNFVNKTLDAYNWKSQPLSKEYIIGKLIAFKTYGIKAWMEDTPVDYFMHQHDSKDNANFLHEKCRGVIEVGLKIAITDPFALNKLLVWENLDNIAQKIIDDPNEVFELTCKSNYGSVITNGTAILGLGNIGALAGMPVMEGKCVLFKHFGGTNMSPLCIQELDPYKMIAYVQRVSPTFCAINLEDIKGPDCFTIESKLIELVECPMFHDDQHGTACIVLAGLINSVKLRGNKPADVKIVMNGAGAAGISVCRLLKEYGFTNFIVCDTTGAIYKNRPKNMNPFKDIIASFTNPNLEKGKLVDVIKGADIVIGLSGPKTITKEMIKSMNPKPIIFALANPVPEIYPQEAYEAGAYIVATGRSDFPNQVNNSMCFPGIFRGAIDSRAPKITQEMKIAAAKAIAAIVDEEELSPDFILPNALNYQNAIKVAVEVAKVAKEMHQTEKKDICLNRVEENLRSFFLFEKLGGIGEKDVD